ncbi:hypothetical protein HPP92_001745 [Vanilla planifolia]|uniref:Peptidase A1 domain-containing protein n=1 Tax=Vanilla planifolia TaxID=51239 RepID=A0A835RWT5_VANPL|nr:hypothetical protein HPP92_001745 [Vanilla planifolia]
MATAASDSLPGSIFFFFLCFLIFSLTVVLLPKGSSASSPFGFDIHHRFSDPVRQWADSRNRSLPGGWPEKGTPEYYAALVGHDNSLHGRVLAQVEPELAFSHGNQTLMISSLGFLHYAVVSLGTPGVKFLVALDTGSNLFWVPCDCESCAPTNLGQGISLNIYYPSLSNTSKKVTCNSTFCSFRKKSECPGEDGICQYMVEYVSAETSSSGFLVNDILYLTTEDSHPQMVKAPIVFGCGQAQTGSFLGDAAPNGLFGLGVDHLSVPSVLSSMGLISNSFSMCFGRDSLGRINFGDQGSSDQEETPFDANQRNSLYNISIIGIEVGNNSADVSFSALVDSGTSFTTLADPAYTMFAEDFTKEVKDKKASVDSSIPFEYCYLMSSNASVDHLPVINLKTQGGGKFPINYPVILVSNQQRDFMYCLALIKSSKLNIIGQNFLTGLRVVFDRERMIFGWKKFNCYDIEDSNPLPVKPGNSSLSPSTPLGPNGYNPEAASDPRNGTQVTVLSPPSNLSSSLNCFVSIRLVLFLFLSIL